jgi:hypothetical protein
VAAKNAQEFIEELNIELADDEIHDWIYSAWEAATDAVVEKFTSTNSDYAAALRHIIINDLWEHDDTNSGVDKLLSLIELRLHSAKSPNDA